ncbi:hypothetical protein LV75_006558 [Actinokineospora diospyrosa]|uniref:Uncharacterized protein n=1 Tax=Actinokineospora diospyrosa TaxID=103728 RepID=A0ABT1INI1_9PSEU|nr:hypothetical protein [Actinokineospora diospyrosa]
MPSQLPPPQLGHSERLVPPQPSRASPANPAPWAVGPSGANLPPPDPPQPTSSALGHSEAAVPTRLPSGPPRPGCSAPGHSDPSVPTCPQSGPPPAHLLSAWTLGPGGVSPARSRRPCQPSTWTVGLAGAKPARWGGLVLRGGTTPVAFQRGRACFWAPALRFCVGCCRGPAQNKFAPSSLSHCRVSRRCCRQATRRFPEPKAEARIPCPAPPATADVKINLIESPQIHSLPRSTDTTGAPNNALWTSERIVDNHPPQPASQDHLPQEPPIYSLPRKPATTGAASGSLWTTERIVDNHPRNPRPQDQLIEKPPVYSLPTSLDKKAAADSALWTTSG